MSYNKPELFIWLLIDKPRAVMNYKYYTSFFHICKHVTQKLEKGNFSLVVFIVGFGPLINHLYILIITASSIPLPKHTNLKRYGL